LAIMGSSRAACVSANCAAVATSEKASQIRK
jgi:hypothetical protein